MIWSLAAEYEDTRQSYLGVFEYFRNAGLTNFKRNRIVVGIRQEESRGKFQMVSRNELKQKGWKLCEFGCLYEKECKEEAPNSVVYVITNVYNESEAVKKIYDVIMNQSLRPAKWIWINDGSTDNTGDVIRELAKNSPIEFEIVDMPRKEKGDLDTVGFGMREVVKRLKDRNERFDYVLKVDVDTAFCGEYLKILVREMENDTTLGAVSGFIIGESKIRTEPVPVGSGRLMRGNLFLRFKPELMPDVVIDSYAVVKFRIWGYKSKSLPIPIYQSRPTTQLTSKGIRRQGRLMYYHNYHPLLVFLSVIYRIMRRQNGGDLIKGYLEARRKKWKIKDPDVRWYFALGRLFDMKLWKFRLKRITGKVKHTWQG